MIQEQSLNKKEAKFHKEYLTLSSKYGYDFIAAPLCSNKFLYYIIKMFGQRARLTTRMYIKKVDLNTTEALIEKLKKDYILTPRSKQGRKKKQRTNLSYNERSEEKKQK